MSSFVVIYFLVNTVSVCYTDQCDCEIEYDFAFCYHLTACPPEYVNTVQVECQIRSIQRVSYIPQLMIHGECRDIVNFINLCRYKIQEPYLLKAVSLRASANPDVG
jgi:hypothetical protein